MNLGIEKICGIYKISSPSGKNYIGQSIHIYKRWRGYINNMNKNPSNRNQPKIYNSFVKYGIQKHHFEIICECEQSELNELEIHYAELYDVYGDKGLNLRQCGGSKGKLAQETKDKLREINLGKKYPQSTRDKISLSMKGGNSGSFKKGMVVSKEKREKLSLSMKGEKNHMYGIKRPDVTERCKGKVGAKASQETKDKMSLMRAGVPKSEKHKQSLRKPKSEQGRLNIIEGLKKSFAKLKKTEKYNSVEEKEKRKERMRVMNKNYWDGIRQERLMMIF